MAAAPAGEAAAAGEPSDDEVAGAASSAALTTSLEPAFLIGKKDTEFLDDEAPAAEVTLAGRTNTVDVVVIAISGFFLFFFFLSYCYSDTKECFLIGFVDSSNMLVRLRKEELFEMFWVKRIVSLHLRSATCTSHICS